MKTGLGGGPPTTLVSGLLYAGSIEVDTSALYFMASDGLLRMPLDGGAVTTLSTGGIAMALDATNVYWTTVGYYVSQSQMVPGSVMTIPKAGGTATTLAVTLPNDPAGVAVDDTSVYWADNLSGTVVRLTPK